MSQWKRSWYASQTQFDDRFFGHAFSHASFENQTVRMVIHPHDYGSIWRIKFSNLYGVYPLTLDSVTLASHRNNVNFDDQDVGNVTFKGSSKIVIPVGKELYSDPISYHADPSTDLTISLYLPVYTKVSTWHFSPARSTYIAQGNQTKVNDGKIFDTSTHSYYWLTALDVEVMSSEVDPGVFVVMGDSITEGYASSLNANQRWPDLLLNRIRQVSHAQPFPSILNAGLTGNMILRDARDVEEGAALGLANAGERMLDRLEREGFTQPGLKGIIFNCGINDIFGDATSEQLIRGLNEMIDRTKKQHLKVAICTVTPFGKSHFFTDEREKVRQEVNQWIRSNAQTDLIIDLDRTLADPQEPTQMLHIYDSGDKAHPNDDGNKAIAEAIPLSFFYESSQN